MALLALLQPAAAADGRAPPAGGLRALRRGAAVRRRRHHAGHLGAGRRRGHQRGRAAAARRGWCPFVSSLILVALFMFQRRGTARVGAVFGRIMVVWFTAIAVLGVRGIFRHPEVLAAVNPWHAVTFFVPRRSARFPHPRRGRAGGDRRRGAVRRHGALRQAPDPAGLVRRGAAGPGAQLLRPGRPAAGPTRRRPRTRSTRWCRRGRCIRWSASRRRRRWWRRRR